MAITNEKELKEAAASVSILLQSIYDYLKDNPNLIPSGRIRFPRGLIKTAEAIREGLPFVSENTLKTNLSYNIMLTYVNDWVINHTDLFGTGLEMSIKWQIAIMTASCEAIIKDVTKEKVGNGVKFCDRCDRMVKLGITNSKLSNELKWLWDIRKNIHLDVIDGSEHQKYEMKDYVRAKKTVIDLRRQLKDNVSKVLNQKVL